VAIAEGGLDEPAAGDDDVATGLPLLLDGVAAWVERAR
jgi:hypothetical protein